MRIGLFFGSYNPLHVGHLIIADYVLDFYDVQEIWLVLSPQNPMKDAEILAPDEERAEMIRLALDEADSRIKLCEVELSMPRPSYTIDTLRHLATLHPNHEFVVMLGSDCLDTLPGWKDYQSLISGWDFYIYPRSPQAYYKALPSPRFTLVDAPILGISSTQVREVIAAGGEALGYMPSDEWIYIKRLGLYRNQKNTCNARKI